MMDVLVQSRNDGHNGPFDVEKVLWKPSSAMAEGAVVDYGPMSIYILLTVCVFGLTSPVTPRGRIFHFKLKVSHSAT